MGLQRGADLDCMYRTHIYRFSLCQFFLCYSAVLIIRLVGFIWPTCIFELCLKKGRDYKRNTRNMVVEDDSQEIKP